MSYKAASHRTHTRVTKYYAQAGWESPEFPSTKNQEAGGVWAGYM